MEDKERGVRSNSKCIYQSLRASFLHVFYLSHVRAAFTFTVLSACPP